MNNQHSSIIEIRPPQTEEGQVLCDVTVEAISLLVGLGRGMTVFLFT